ncbi:MAG TPA: acetyl-CoA decarbonylase/synthase complex subunit gamma [Victivallales bacterium]|nr:acetyl-CoA decarbonylase/synthase complex subunit gamma [Victivallales bacterium]
MALTAMDIYKSLPRTNCKECGFPTCMMFAMQVAAKQKAITDCPHISDDAKSDLSEASTPPIKLVKIGSEVNQVEIGQETVMFRHEEKFHHPAGLAVRIPASLSDSDALDMAEKINSSKFERVGEELKVAFCAVEIEGCNEPALRVKSLSDKIDVPIILIGKDVNIMKSCVEAIKSERPLIYKADRNNIDGFIEIALSSKCPLSIEADTLEEAADLTKKAKDKGLQNIILSFNGKEVRDTLELLTKVRRAALKKNFRPLGYPTMVEVDSDTPEEETVTASIYAAKYASIIIINGIEAWQILPIVTTVQNIYTDPQVPNTVEAKLYEIGSPDESSPVMFTTNFALTYFSVAGEVERSKIASYISVVDTEGLGVLNAYAGDKISVEKVVKTMNEQNITNKVKHRKLIIPGLLPIYRAEIEDTSDWEEVIIGTESAREIPAFLNKIWK